MFWSLGIEKLTDDSLHWISLDSTCLISTAKMFNGNKVKKINIS